MDPWSRAPVVLRYEPPAFTRGQSWYDAPAERLRVDVRVLDDVSPEGAGRSGISSSVAARSLTAELRKRFEKALENHQTP
jgi:hypothetical protein